MARGLHSDGIPAGFVQEAGKVAGSVERKLGLPHYILAATSTVVALVASAFFGIGGTGPAGPPGTTRVVQQVPVAGVCAYFGPDATGRLRFQVSTPKNDAAGPWCPKGKYISVVPKK